MAKVSTATGIILKRHDYGEADKILTVLTKDHGKCVFIAKGVRKMTSRRKGHLELFSHITLSFHGGPSWGIITEEETLDQFDAMVTSWEHLGNAFHIGEIVDRLLPEEEPNERVYTIFVRFLQAISKESVQSKRETIVRLCEQTLLEELGYWNAEEFGTYQTVQDKSTVKERNVHYIQSILERELKSIKIFERLNMRPIYVEE